MTAPHRRGRYRTGALMVATALLMTTAPAVSAGPASPVRPAAGEAPACRGALTPLALPAETPAGAVLSHIDAASASSVYVYENDDDGQGGGHLLLHGPSTGPFVRTTGMRPDMTVNGLVTVDERHAWVVGYAYDRARTHDALEVWRTDGDVVSKVAIPSALVSPQLTTIGGDVDGASDQDVWVHASQSDPGSTEGTTFLLHWDGRAWKRFDKPPAPGYSVLGSARAIGGGAALATVSDAEGQSTWYRVDDAGFHAIESPGPNMQMASGGHTRPVVSGFSGTSTPTALVKQWRDGAWHTLPAPPVGRGFVRTSYRVGPDGSVWAGISTAPYRYPGSDMPLRLIALDGDQWVSMGTLDNPAVNPLPRFVNSTYSMLAPVSSTEVLQVSWGNPYTIPASLQRSCYPLVSPSGVSPARVQSEMGLPVVVRADASLTSPAVLTDDLGLRATERVQPGHWGQLSYPWPGTFTATLRGSGSTITTSTTLGYVEKVDWRNYVLYGTLQVAAKAPPTGWTFEVQAQAPGESTWSLLTRTNEKSVRLEVPNSLPTIWHYRARMVRTDGTASSGWSAVSEVRLRFATHL